MNAISVIVFYLGGVLDTTDPMTTIYGVYFRTLGWQLWFQEEKKQKSSHLPQKPWFNDRLPCRIQQLWIQASGSFSISFTFITDFINVSIQLLGGYDPGRYEMHIYFMNPLMMAWYISMVIVMISGFLFFFLFTVSVIRHMKELAKVLSKATLEAHRMFNLTMLLQVNDSTDLSKIKVQTVFFESPIEILTYKCKIQMSVTLSLFVIPMAMVFISLSVESGIPPSKQCNIINFWI